MTRGLDDPAFEETAVLDRLADLWQRRDPLPPGVIDRMLVALAVADLDAEYEMLALVSRTRELAGTRSNESETMTFVFANEQRTLMMRIAPLESGFCRIDGWITPPQSGTVRLERGSVATEASADIGRFELDRVIRGSCRVVFLSQLGSDLATPFFDL